MRVTTAFNRVLQLPGTSVTAVEFTDDAIVLRVRQASRGHRCPCGQSVRAGYDRSRRRWRHVDFGSLKVWLEAEIMRIRCPACSRVRTEQVPWARPGARHSRDFDDVVAWLAQRMDKTSVATLMRCAWTTVDHCVARLVSEHLDDARLDGVYRIGVDEISYKRGHRYLTVIADHDTGRVIWVAKERTKEAFQQFFDALGPERAAALQAVTCDAASTYQTQAREQAPNATVCLDPFHIIKWTNEALDATYQAERNPSPQLAAHLGRHGWRRTRTALRTGEEKLRADQQALIDQFRRHRWRLFQAYELKKTSARSTATCTPTTPEHGSPAGSPTPPPAPCPRSSRSPDASNATTNPSSPQCTSAYQTHDSKASTQRSESSNAAATAIPTRNH